MKRATQKEVAEACGVSRMAVALVLGTSAKRPGAEKRVSAAKREKIIRVAEELGYRPNRSAQLMRGASSGLIGYIKSLSLHPSQIKLARFVSDAVAAGGEHKLLTAEVVSDRTELAEELDMLLDLRVEGLILQGAGPIAAKTDPGLFDRVRAAGVPVVMIGGPPQKIFPMVSFDYAQGMRDLVGHLVALGCRRLAHASLLPEDGTDEPRLWANQARLKGFREGAAAAGLKDAEALVWRTPKIRSPSEDYDLGHETGLRLAGEHSLPDAVLAHNDAFAVGMLGAFRRNGIRVPEDIRVTGFDDAAVGRFNGTPLTTVRLPLKAVSRRAVEILRAQIEGEADSDYSRNEQIQGELLVRESTSGATSPS